MGNNQTRSTQENVRELSSTTQVNEPTTWSLGFFRKKAFAALLLSSLYAFVQSSCSKSSELEDSLTPKNWSKGWCNDVTCTLKFERDYVVAERVNDSGHDMSTGIHLTVDGVPAQQVSYVDEDGLCLFSGAGDLPSTHAGSVVQWGEIQRDTFYYAYLAVDGQPLRWWKKIQTGIRVQPMHSESGMDFCQNDGTTAQIPK